MTRGRLISTFNMEGMTIINSLSFRYSFDGPEYALVVLMSNSLSSDLTIWDSLIPSLISRFRILRYDHRGHGETEVPNKPCTFERLADDAAELLDNLQIAKIAAFIGDSMGAATAIVFSGRHPGRVESYVVMDTITASSAPAH